MTSSSDDLEKALQQNLKLRRELGTEIAKASNSSAKQMAEAPATPRNQPPKLTTSEARQGTGPRAMFWVLIGSLTLAVIAGPGRQLAPQHLLKNDLFEALRRASGWPRRDLTAASVFVVFGELDFVQSLCLSQASRL